jgi:aldose 1-epimerase
MMRDFGHLANGRAIQVITLGAAEGLQAQILTYGGILHSLSLPIAGGRRELILALPALVDYEHDPAFLGQLIGRFGNRIAGAAFRSNGKIHRLSANNGANHLHGGSGGFGRCVWNVLEVEHAPAHRLRLGLRSPAGDQGFPGNLDVVVEFAVLHDELRLRFHAQCDAVTPVNLTYHPYFNLSGDARRPVHDLHLRLSAGLYLPVADSQLIPTGELLPVAETPFDFRALRPIGAPDPTTHPQLANGGGYDHCWALDTPRDWDAELWSPQSGVHMSIQSTQPGLQFYGGQSLPIQHPGLHGVCLEPQGFPNSVNERRFPSAMLRPGEIYHSEFRYQFSVASKAPSINPSEPA